MGTVLHRKGHRMKNAAIYVSVPFSMGTVLHPLADGYHVAALTLVSVPFSMGTVLHQFQFADICPQFRLFQSPSRWGRCCIIGGVPRIPAWSAVSVPFSMGTVLHRHPGEVPLRAMVVSVPFSMGTVLHQGFLAFSSRKSPSFSPLLDGDGVAS